jgi:hypothetical protein
MEELNRRGCFIALIGACGAGVFLLFILVVGYLIWGILSMYFRMKSGG